MFKLDNAFLEQLGLGSLPAIEKNKMLAHIYETLEMRVGMRLAEQMSNEQLDEFEGYINRKDEAGALQWLESNFPNYKQVVAEELDKLKNEIAQVAPQIVAQAQQTAQQNPQVSQPQQQSTSAQNVQPTVSTQTTQPVNSQQPLAPQQPYQTVPPQSQQPPVQPQQQPMQTQPPSSPAPAPASVPPTQFQAPPMPANPTTPSNFQAAGSPIQPTQSVSSNPPTDQTTQSSQDLSQQTPVTETQRPPAQPWNPDSSQ